MNSHKISSITLNSLFILLFFISFNINAAELADLTSDCTLALNKGEFTKAITVSETIIKLEPSGSAGYLCKGRALGAQGNYAAALIALDLSTKNAKDSFDQIIGHTVTGNLHKQFNKNAAAITSYEKSLEICKAVKNDKFARINHTLIGETQVLNKTLDLAIASFTASEKLSNNDHERADSYEHLATTYSAMGKHDLAIEFQVKAVLMQRKSGTLDQLANASLEMGRIYTVAKDLPNAEKTYTKLAEFSKENGGSYYEAKAYIGMAQTKFAIGDKASANTWMDQAKLIATNTQDKALMLEIESAIKSL